MKKLNKKGFTLIEMLVVIAIIAILVAIIVPTVSKSTFKSQCAVDAANLRTITAEAAIDYLDNNILDKTYTMDVKSTNKSNQNVAFVITADGELVGIVDNHSVEHFATGAEKGEMGTQALPTGTAPATTAVS